ncbi:MAG: NAD(P)/FAD-dependent oxidoreductase [Minisyncoccia bacterium]
MAEITPEVHDLIIVGGGPAGLTAAIMAESERVDTLLIDGNSQLGGQAGTSSFIENYPGYADGITGGDLMSHFTDQASRFNTEFVTLV